MADEGDGAMTERGNDAMNEWAMRSRAMTKGRMMMVRWLDGWMDERMDERMIYKEGR